LQKPEIFWQHIVTHKLPIVVAKEIPSLYGLITNYAAPNQLIRLSTLEDNRLCRKAG